MPTPSEAVTCGAVRSALEAYVDGDLGRPRCLAIEGHLNGCPACSEQHRLAVEIRRELRALPQLDAPPALLEPVLAKSRRRLRRAALIQLRPAWLAAAGLALLAIALATLLAMRQDRLAPGPSEAEIARATLEAKYAFASLGKVTRRAGNSLSGRVIEKHIVMPSAVGLARAFQPRLESDDTSLE